MIAVVGSINMDLVAEVAALPRPGETVFGRSFRRYPGGKGANQAVAVARMGVEVALYGKVGQDQFGVELVEGLREAGVVTAAIEGEAGVPTGCACISVAADGENTIVYVPGANHRVDVEYIERILDRLVVADVVLVQLETPVRAVGHLLQRLARPGPTVILDPAPAESIRELPLDRIDFLTPNRCELEQLTGERDHERAAQLLLGWGVRGVICKDGVHGSYLFSADAVRQFPAFPVVAVDSTAAGDAFNGALAAALARGLPPHRALPWANAAGALAATRFGAQPSLPTFTEVAKLVESR